MRREGAREGKEGFKTLRKEENEEGRKEGEDEGRLRVGIKRKHQRCHCWKRPQKLHCYFIAGTAQMREAQRLACSRACPRAEPRCRPQLCPLGASGRKRKDRHVRGLSRTFGLLISRHESALLLLPKRGRPPLPSMLLKTTAAATATAPAPAPATATTTTATVTAAVTTTIALTSPSSQVLSILV